MARKIETREIGENTFRVKVLKVRKANTILTRLIKIVGEPLGAAADQLGSEPGESVIGDMGRGGFADAAGALKRTLGDEDLNWLIDQLRPSIEIHTKEMTDPDMFVPMTADHWDDEFAGELLLQFKLLAFVLELNYSSFFAGMGGLKGMAAKFTTPSKSASKPPKTATTGSGD